MQTIIPPKLKTGDGVRVITPARSLSLPFLESVKELATKRLNKIGLEVSFGNNVYEIELRVADLHDAFSDKSVNLILTVIGGFNSNQLLRYLDFDLIKKNPKIICGYSDITALTNAIYAKTGLVSYSGPHFFNFGDQKSFDYTLDYFKKCYFHNENFEIIPSQQWSDDKWALNQENRILFPNSGYLVINQGETEGKVIGGNLCTLNLLQGTEYMPDLQDSILFIEDDYESAPYTFDRDLQSLIHQPNFSGVRGIVVGRFQIKSNMTNDLLIKIIKSKKELENIPVIANADFGHTTPMITFPIGGSAYIKASNKDTIIKIINH